MKKILIIAILIVSGTLVKAQILTPVHWSYGAKKISKDEAVVLMKATIDEGWHLYSQTVKEGGPVKTTFTFPASKLYTLVGKTIEPTPITRNEKVFNMDVSFFEHEVIFQQRVKLKAGQVTVKGTLQYMTCNDHQCLPPEDLDFSIMVK
ncbi:sugar transporter [Mucilaginibacter sp. PPCGB 2223]|uniref:protein-disulfide reductase DsbD domain-containing protein n=1 Tax=Mucilaginibacter sp. PPCGB 2223 TaxID=1886027 RepID=UPI0008271DDB|nr:protein-disulfide reductase DsbD domain-containing protein [Mucilaginibacter sp. PPCGB 2223]OCX54371.1 sugar transporter [Mucilaginibacter sp. PPCGB 2223]